MAAIPFTDTHVHFHDFSQPSLRWDWLEGDARPDPDLGDYSALKTRRYLARDFVAETRFCNVERVIHVEAARGTLDPVDETGWLQTAADELGVPHGIVAYANLADNRVEHVLEQHAHFPNLRGIRDRRSDRYLADRDWEHGFSTLGRRGLVFCDDPVVTQMPILAALAGRHPQTVICIDHAGFPRCRDRDYFERWRLGMKELASQPSTVPL